MAVGDALGAPVEFDPPEQTQGCVKSYSHFLAAVVGTRVSSPMTHKYPFCSINTSPTDSSTIIS